MFCSCLGGSIKSEKTDVLPIDSSKEQNNLDAIKLTALTNKDSISVLVIPCSNGYVYNLRMGDLNPSLEKYLKIDKRVILIDFPYKKMNGAGYFGVYDKNACTEILKQVKVDFLIMTQMKGMDIQDTDSNPGNWGYETKVLNVRTMQQFQAIHSENLKSFYEIDSDIQQKINKLVELIINSSNSK